MTEQTLCIHERKILRRIYGPIQDKGRWRPRWDTEIYNLYKDLNIVDDMKIRRLGWVCHVTRVEDERIAKRRFLMGNIIIQDWWQNSGI